MAARFVRTYVMPAQLLAAGVEKALADVADLQARLRRLGGWEAADAREAPLNEPELGVLLA